MFTTDNMACMHIINTTTSEDRQVMKLVRSMVASSLKHNILFKARHIPGSHNVIPDLLSRFQFQKALSMAPWLDKEQSPLPQALAPAHMLP
jgi:hypothetical protein